MEMCHLHDGDVILETSRELHKGALGDLYLVCFVAVFIFVIMSVFISIIQDAYIQAKAATGGAGAAAAVRMGRRRGSFPTFHQSGGGGGGGMSPLPGVGGALGSDDLSAAALAARLSDHMGDMRAMMAEAESLHAALIEAIVVGGKSGVGGGGGVGGVGSGGSGSGAEDGGNVRVVVGAAADSSQLHYRKK